MPPASALPLKVTPSTPQSTVSHNKKTTGLGDPGTTPTQTSPASGLPNPGTTSTAPAKAGDISSPHELTAFVCDVLPNIIHNKPWYRWKTSWSNLRRGLTICPTRFSIAVRYLFISLLSQFQHQPSDSNVFPGGCS
jgi:hypothetical protein